MAAQGYNIEKRRTDDEQAPEDGQRRDMARMEVCEQNCCHQRSDCPKRQRRAKVCERERNRDDDTDDPKTRAHSSSIRRLVLAPGMCLVIALPGAKSSPRPCNTGCIARVRA